MFASCNAAEESTSDLTCVTWLVRTNDVTCPTDMSPLTHWHVTFTRVTWVVNTCVTKSVISYFIFMRDMPHAWTCLTRDTRDMPQCACDDYVMTHDSLSAAWQDAEVYSHSCHKESEGYPHSCHKEWEGYPHSWDKEWEGYPHSWAHNVSGIPLSFLGDIIWWICYDTRFLVRSVTGRRWVSPFTRPGMRGDPHLWDKEWEGYPLS